MNPISAVVLAWDLYDAAFRGASAGFASALQVEQMAFSCLAVSPLLFLDTPPAQAV